ncbi:MAG TPA: RNA polymerase sigma factor [Chthonomonadales bacterium]|nr:RNA polymerase sigma factor [Chthonomonadales bacterium]
MDAVTARRLSESALDRPESWREMSEERRLEVFAAIYGQYEQQVFRHAYYLLGHREDADDVKQETFVRAYQAMPGFRSESSLSTWLLRICSNLCHTRLRSRSRRAEILYDPQDAQERAFVADQVDLFSRVDREATVDAIWRVIRGLPPAQSRLIVMSLVEGRRHDEIADILGCSALSAKLRVFRARKHFRQRVFSVLGIED